MEEKNLKEILSLIEKYGTNDGIHYLAWYPVIKGVITERLSELKARSLLKGE